VLRTSRLGPGSRVGNSVERCTYRCRVTLRQRSRVKVAADVGKQVLIAVLVALLTTASTWALGLPTPGLMAVALGMTTASLVTVAMLERRRNARIAATIRNYCRRPAIGSSELLPIGPSGDSWTPVGEILSTPGLVVPQRWRPLAHDATAIDTDFAHDLVRLIDLGMPALLVGEPGMGKSLTARRAFQLLAARSDEHPTRSPFPVLVSLGEITSLAQTTDSEDPLGLLDVVTELTGLSHVDVARLARRGTLVLLLDALDESSQIGGDLRSVRQALAGPLFGSVGLLTTRYDHYARIAGLAAIRHRFRVVAELQPLPFDDNVRSFVHAYCDRFRLDASADVLALLGTNESLRDLAARPLTLWMVVDVLASASGAGVRTLASLTSLYRDYTEKWLRIETTKSDARVVGIEDRQTLVRLAARAMFHRGTAVAGSLRSTAELAVSREQLAVVLAADESGPLVHAVVARHGLDAVVDEVCTRTFLVQGGRRVGYRFTHKSFFEYFVAFDMKACLAAEQRLEVARSYFERPLSDPIVYFFREMLAEVDGNPEQRQVVAQNMFGLFDESQGALDVASQTVRQHVGNLMPRVLDARGEAQLVARLGAEPSEFVRRGIIVGLGLQRDRRDLVDAYVANLDTDPTAASIHLGYSRVYHGDQEWNGEWRDDATGEVTRTVDAQVDRLLSDRNRELNEKLWPLTLFTLRQLIEDGRGVAALRRDARVVEALRQFVALQRPELGDVFERERSAVSRLLDDLG
jgi:hypothetical protein